MVVIIMNNTNITGEELDVNEIKFEKFKAEAKKKINDTLGIDENRNKEVESDEIMIKKEEKK